MNHFKLREVLPTFFCDTCKFRVSFSWNLRKRVLFCAEINLISIELNFILVHKFNKRIEFWGINSQDKIQVRSNLSLSIKKQVRRKKVNSETKLNGRNSHDWVNNLGTRNVVEIF